MLKKIIRFLPLLVSLFFIQFISAQLSKKHYLPPLSSSDGFTDQYIYISTPKKNNVAYKITPIGNPDLPAYSGIVSNANPVQQSVLELDGSIDNNASNDDDSQLQVPIGNLGSIFTNKGFIIEAEDVVYVSVRVRSSISPTGEKYHAGALVSKGISALGTQFRIGGFVREIVGNSDLTFASILATENNTNITIQLEGNAPMNITLNKNESYITSAQGASANNIIGGLISSDKPIVVNSGSALGSFGNNNRNADYGFDQIVDASKVGNEYILVKGAGTIVEKVLIIAHEDNTEFSINGVAVGTINAGKYYIVEESYYGINGNMYINSTKPVFIYQGVGGNSNQANQGMFFVPPLSCENVGDVDNIANINNIGNGFFNGGLTIVTNTNSTISINNTNIDQIQDVQGPFNVIGNPDYETYKIEGLTGNIQIKSDKELYCAYFNYSGAATSGAFYSGFPSPPEFVFNTTVSSLGNCIPNLTLQATNIDIFDSYQWEYFNEITGVWDVKVVDIPDYKPLPSETGRYRLVGTVNCTGAKFQSAEIPVSICPDDFDGDLIIDNLDVDLDNDGILNIDESTGNATIDFTSTDNPLLIFQDNSTNTSITTGKFTTTESTNTITGQNNGDFTSVLNPATSSNSTYELNFTQKINFLFKQRITGNHTINPSEYFILKINPNNKNITLLDPDGQLMVDSNFDGEFESGITYISASEIRFKFKNDLSGVNSTFQFVANQINQLTFEHKSTGLTAISSFSGNIQLTTFTKDSDGDGIEDMFDVDSDNDGIPDIDEAAASKITLLNTDANEDGLDDAFNGITTGIDTDNDNVPNHLDLDADNDGIFDLVEAGHAGVDVDMNGILDNATAANVGINGLLNSLESTADAKILSLNYTLLDTDADNIFNFQELDADGDDCFDVIEAGFTGNGSGILSASPFGVDVNGKVTGNIDGYTTPNSNYVTIAPIIINNFGDTTFCENTTDILSIDSTADQFQWEVSSDNGNSWTPISDDAIYTGATTKDLQITKPPITFDKNQYRVALNRTGNTCGKTSNAIILTVNPEPVLKANPTLNQCIDVGNTNPTVNLTLAEKNITDETNVTFQYFEDIAGTTEITNPTSYPVVVNTTQSVYVKVTSALNCYTNLAELKINIGQTPDNPYNDLQPAVCDDFLDAAGNDSSANSDTDNITQFYLDKTAIENGINPLINTTVFYYENATDRTNSIAEIDITNYRNHIDKIDITNIPSGIQFPIYYKIISNVNNSCEGLGKFYLQINSVPTANTVSDLEVCDDGSNGITTDGIENNINLSSQDPFILGSQSPADFTVTYHINETDAATGNNSQSIPFTNTVAYSQKIFVRVTNNVTGCFNNHTAFNVIVNPLPIANFVPDLEVCDDNTDGSARNGFSQSIDLESQSAGILGTQDPITFKVSYHRSLADAQAGIKSLVSPYENAIPFKEIIYVRVFNEITQCSNAISQFDVIVNPEPTFEPINNLAYCDDDNDGDDTNGVIQSIDLDSKIPDILGVSQSKADYNVTFHATPTDATNGTFTISSPYTNTNSTETIYVRIQNKKTGCVNDDASFEVIVNPLPSFMITSPQILCLNDLPLNISVENPMDIYSYEWTNESGIILGNNDNINVSSGGKYFVTATTTNGTMCSRTEMIEINESNIASLENSFVTIIDESTNIGSQDNLSIVIDIIHNNLGPGEYQFAIINTDTNERIPFAGFQEEPLFENLEGGIYQIIVNDKNGCSPDATLLVSVIQFPKFFTPNADGENDTWVVKGANKTFYPNARINIFNRYGKIVAQIPIDSLGWDGTYGGKLLPSDDYWFNVTLIPADTSKPTINKKGNFSLLRK